MDFRTERLAAERLCLAHLGDLTAYHLDPEVTRYLGGIRSPARTEEYLNDNLAHWDEHGFGLWVLRTIDGAFAGRAGIRHIEVEDTPEVEIAYALWRHLWRRGLASEIAQALVAIWRDRRLSPALIGIASLANGPSRRALAKVGLRYERDVTYHSEAVALDRTTL